MFQPDPVYYLRSPGKYLYDTTNWPLEVLASTALWPNNPDLLPSKPTCIFDNIRIRSVYVCYRMLWCCIGYVLIICYEHHWSIVKENVPMCILSRINMMRFVMDRNCCSWLRGNDPNIRISGSWKNKRPTSDVQHECCSSGWNWNQHCQWWRKLTYHLLNKQLTIWTWLKL